MSTKLIVTRHADQINDGYAEDELKPLSQKGRHMQRQMAERLRSEGIQPSLILASPLLRAVQSAEILSEVLQTPFVLEPALGVDFDEDVILSRLQPNETVLLVGHMPTLVFLVEKLVGARVLPNGIGKSGVVRLTLDEIGWGMARFE